MPVAGSRPTARHSSTLPSPADPRTMANQQPSDDDDQQQQKRRLIIVANNGHKPSSSSQPHQQQVNHRSPAKYRLWMPPRSSATHPANGLLKAALKSHDPPPDDAEEDCLDDCSFFKYLNLVDKRLAEQKSHQQLLQSWPLRNVAKCQPPQRAKDGQIIIPDLQNNNHLKDLALIKQLKQKSVEIKEEKSRWTREANDYNAWLNDFKQNLPDDDELKSRIHEQLEQMHVRLMAWKEVHTKKEKENQAQLTSAEQRRKQVDQSQEVEDCHRVFDFTSPMASRVRKSIDPDGNDRMTARRVYDLIRDYEKKSKPPSLMDLQNQCDTFSVSTSSSRSAPSRLTRAATGGVNKLWGPRRRHREYCFTRQQRLDRYRRLNTGLNWRSRLLKLHCKPIRVPLLRITRCPLCWMPVEPHYGHSCQNSDVSDEEEEETKTERETEKENSGENGEERKETEIVKVKVEKEEEEEVIKADVDEDVDDGDHDDDDDDDIEVIEVVEVKDVGRVKGVEQKELRETELMEEEVEVIEVMEEEADESEEMELEEMSLNSRRNFSWFSSSQLERNYINFKS